LFYFTNYFILKDWSSIEKTFWQTSDNRNDRWLFTTRLFCYHFQPDRFRKHKQMSCDHFEIFKLKKGSFIIFKNMFVQYLYTCKVHLKDGRLNKYKKVFVRSMLIFHHLFAFFIFKLFFKIIKKILITRLDRLPEQ
jgi:hypothetical protein